MFCCPLKSFHALHFSVKDSLLGMPSVILTPFAVISWLLFYSRGVNAEYTYVVILLEGFQHHMVYSPCVGTCVTLFQHLSTKFVWIFIIVYMYSSTGGVILEMENTVEWCLA